MTCFECGSVATENHHVVPKIRGGTKTVPLCSRCHGLVHGRKNTMSIKRLTREALALKRAKGEKTGGQYSPYGFDAINGLLVRNEKEQSVIEIMCQLREDGISYQKIADKLNVDGYLSKSGKNWSHNMIYKTLLRKIRFSL